MAKMQISSIVKNVLICSSLILNLLLLVNVFLRSRSPWEKSWARSAVEEAEVVESIYCSGHGRAFLDGVLVHGKPVCECNACYGGSDCSELLPDCIVDADSGDPTFLEPFWVKNGASSTIVISGWHRMSYEFSEGSLISQELKRHIETVHAITGNAITQGKHIIFGPGATLLLHAAVHSLSAQHSASASPVNVVASVPYYQVYREQTEFFRAEDYKFSGDDSEKLKHLKSSSSNIIEIVTSPNNPDGGLRKAVLEGPSVKKVYDLAYYWPHFTPIPEPVDEALMIFTLSKFTGHGGSRFGWAIVKDEAVYRKMLTYIEMTAFSVSKETQLRALKLLKVFINNGNGREMSEFGHNIMRSRWIKLSKTFSQSKRFSIQKLEPQYCSFFNQVRIPSPAYGWVKCEREEDTDCYQVLKNLNVTGRAGSLFGAQDRYVRLSLVKSKHDFDLLLRQLEKIISEEEPQLMPSSASSSSAVTETENITRTKINESDPIMCDVLMERYDHIMG